MGTRVRAGRPVRWLPGDGRRAQGRAGRAAFRRPSRKGSVWDTHPPIADRIAAIARTPEPPTYRDGRPAALLLPDLAGIGRRLQETSVRVGTRTVLPWPQFTAATLTARMQRQADAYPQHRAYRARP